MPEARDWRDMMADHARLLCIDGEAPAAPPLDAEPRPGDVMNLTVGLARPEDVDTDVVAALARAHAANS